MRKRSPIPRVGESVLVALGPRPFRAKVIEVRRLGRHTFITVTAQVGGKDTLSDRMDFTVTPDMIRERRPVSRVAA